MDKDLLTQIIILGLVVVSLWAMWKTETRVKAPAVAAPDTSAPYWLLYNQPFGG